MKKSNFKSGLVTTDDLPNDKKIKDQARGAHDENITKAPVNLEPDHKIVSELEPLYDPRIHLKEILKSEERNDREIWTLYDAFKEIKFFRQFISNSDEKERMKALLYVFQKIKYETVGAQRCIIRQGEFSNGKVYIVLSGELNVMINKDPKKAQALLERAETPIDEKEKEKEESQSPMTPLTEISMITPSVLQSPAVSQSILKNHHRPRNSRRKTQSPELGRRTPTVAQSQTVKIDAPPQINRGASFKKIKKNLARKEAIFVEQEQLADYGIIVGQLQTGDHFGEKALFDKHQRSASIITNTAVELLVLDRETFIRVLVGFQRAKSAILDYLSVTLPNLEKVLTKQVLESLMYVADVREFVYRTNLGIEGKPADQLYLIYEGQCELIKTVIYDRSENVTLATDELKSLYGLKKTKKEDLVVLNLERGSFIGEEICFDEKTMLNWTIRVSSERAKIICFPKKLFMFRCPKMILKGIIKIFSEKKERFTQNLLQKLEKKGVETNYKNLMGIKPVVPLTPKINLLISSLSLNSGFPTDVEILQQERQTSEVVKTTTTSIEQKLSPRSKRIISSAKNKRSSGTFVAPTERSFSPGQSRPLTRNNSQKALQNNFKKLKLDDCGSENKTGKNMSSPKSRPLLSARVSPKNQGQGQTWTFYTSMNEVDSTDKIILKAPVKDENFVNNVNNFKMNLGKSSKEVERRYKALVHKYTSPPISKKKKSGSIFESSINLADFITIKLRENNFDSIQDEKLPTGGNNCIYESTLGSMVELQTPKRPVGSLNLDLFKSAGASPTNSVQLTRMQSSSSNMRQNFGTFEEFASQKMSKTPRIQSASTQVSRMPQSARHIKQSSHHNLIGSFNTENFSQVVTNLSPNIKHNSFIPRHIRAKTQILPKDFVNIHVTNRNVSALKKPFS